MPTGPEDLQEAVWDLHLYLSDQKPPLMVVDSVGLLLDQEPGFLGSQIQAWVGSQNLSAPVADYLFHAAKKILLFGELDLLPRDAVTGYLRGLSRVLVSYAPEADRELLQDNLARLTQAAPQVAPAGVLHRQSSAQQAPPASPSSAEKTLTREVRRLSLLLEHLRPLASPTAAPERRAELASQFITTAAVQASSAKELEGHLEPLRQFGIGVDTEEVFRTLARSLAGWILPASGGQTPVVSAEQLQAMRQVVSLATPDPAEAAKRFRELVHAATEQFNQGHIGRASAMFEVAERLVAEDRMKPLYVDPVRKQGQELLDPERLRKSTERTDHRPQFRTIMNFFIGLRPPALLQALNGEPRRERRHELLALLEAHEQAARSEAWALLKASVEPGANADPFFQMNLVYLLRVIPRPAEASVEDEVSVVMRSTGRSSPPPLVKQVIAYLAATRHDKAERALITYLKVFESMLLQPETAAYPPGDLEVLLDRTCAALARYGTPRAWRLLIDHGLKSEARLGSPFLRLSEAGRLDFSSNRDLVDRIIAALRLELPARGLLGLARQKNEDKALSLLGALAGTPLPEVRAVLQEVAANHASGRLGEAAAKALNSLAAAARPAPLPGLSGDLDLFGLPSVLQTLVQSSLTGVLTVMDATGRQRASLALEKGTLLSGQCGAARGEDAVYQLLERPFPGTFAFVSRTDLAAEPRTSPPPDVFSLLMEGVRRHDELKLAVSVVPDGTGLKATGQPRTSKEGEAPEFEELVWKEALSGKSPEECEQTIATDAYRVRRLLAHWVEEGALRPAAA